MQSTDLGKADYFRDLAERLDAAGHGSKGTMIRNACTFLGKSRGQVYDGLKAVGWASHKKLRADKGDSRVSAEEARTVSILMTESTRANGKRLLSVGDALAIALANGAVSCEVSDTTMLRVMRRLGMHPDQIARATPYTPMRSLHPNHTWEFDVSVCVLFYLDKGGMQIMDEKRFYKNKPHNLRKVSKDRVLRYLVSDHYSGTLYVYYYLVAGEDQETLFRFLTDAFTQRDHEQDPFHGVPFQMVWDAGSANQSHLIKNFLDRLDVKHWAHLPGNPRAKGQVENGHNLVECKFEGRLRTMDVRDIDQLNDYAQTWMRWFNGTQIHRRHGHTRYGLWQIIRPEQLRLCPALAVCQDLLTHKPERRQVKGNLVIQYKVKGFDAGFYSVAHVPRVRVGEYVMVSPCVYRAPNVYVIETAEDGSEQRYECEPLGRDAAGFLVDAPVIGEQFKAPPDTDVDANRKQMAKEAYGAETQLEVDKARQSKAPAFGGKMDSISYLDAQTKASYMGRRGTEIDMPDQARVEAKPPLTPGQICVALFKGFGLRLTREQNERIHKWYPNGLDEVELGAVAERLRGGEPTRTEGGLKVVQ